MKVKYSFDPLDHEYDGWIDFILTNDCWDCRHMMETKDLELRFQKCVDNDDYKSVCESLELTVIDLFEWED